MTRDEAKKVLMAVQAAYPNFRVPDKTIAINVWHMALEEYSYGDVSIALMAYIKTDTSGFPPSPGQVIDKIHITDRAAEMSEVEAWAMVSRAVRRGYYYADEEYARLPETIRKAVGSADNIRSWAMTEEREFETVIQSNFMRVYRNELNRKREYAKLPRQIREAIEGKMGNSPRIEKKGDGENEGGA